MLRILFVCSRNRLRSPTAEAIFAGLEGMEVLSAGTAKDADCPVTADLIEWADAVYVMERRQKTLLSKRFPGAVKDRPVVSLDVPDRFRYMQPELIAELRAKVLPLLRMKQDEKVETEA